ncbi:hypothetical protein CPB83DRAFT_846555 [Crepidotus variabilis]|uniref:Uncharacterized protein n=1 Tax=Crepidotus variabilis TaxID=179855 RepID=A0A9P6JTA3_9AGAR|nr:hypothetical protein CPB83DRAFT_846555 [Crepidotus variabilis]
MASFAYRTSLPLDIYHNVFNILAEQHDYGTLKSCLLLCHDLRPICTRSLFLRVDLIERLSFEHSTGNDIPVKKLHSLLMDDSTAIIGSYVQSLHVTFDPKDYISATGSVVDKRLPEALSKLSSVKTFTLTARPLTRTISWDHLDPRFRAAVENIVISPCLASLDITWTTSFPMVEIVEKSNIKHLRYVPMLVEDSPLSRNKVLRLNSLIFNGNAQSTIEKMVNACSLDGQSLFDWTSLKFLGFSDMETDYNFVAVMLSRCVNLSEVKCEIYNSANLVNFMDPIYSSPRLRQLHTITVDVLDYTLKDQARRFTEELDRFPRHNSLHELHLIFYTQLREATMETLYRELDDGIALFNAHFKKDIFPDLERLTIKLVANFWVDPKVIRDGPIQKHMKSVAGMWFPLLKAQYGQGFKFCVVPFVDR